jgi:heme exporter protein C
MNKKTLFLVLWVSAALGFAIAPYLIFFIAPMEPVQGFIQKVFYFHVPCSWAMLLSALICAGGSLGYLFGNRRWGDELGAAAAELTVFFGLLVLITGPLWAKRAWGHFWVWDVRLTTMFILFLIFLAVLLARQYGGPSRRQIAAGLALFGAADVPLIYISVKLWRTIHPENTVIRSLPSGMKWALWISLIAFTMLYLLLLWLRYNLEHTRNQLNDLAASITAHEK